MDMCRKCCYCSEQGGKCALYQSRYDDMEPEAVRKAAKDNVAAEHGRPEIFLFAVKNLCSQGETHYGAAGRILEKGLEAGDEACLSYLISLHYIITYADRNGTIKKLDQIYTSPLTDKVFSDCKYYLRYEKFGDLAASSTNRQHLLWASRFYQMALENYSDHYSTEAPDFPARISEKLDDCHAAWFSHVNDPAMCETFRKARSGDAQAQLAVARYFRDQKNEIACDSTAGAEAVKWYRRAAEQGYADAQYNLGVCYKNGTGTQKDEAEAVKWYRLAAEQGHADAQYNLGWCYMVTGWACRRTPSKLLNGSAVLPNREMPTHNIVLAGAMGMEQVCRKMMLKPLNGTVSLPSREMPTPRTTSAIAIKTERVCRRMPPKPSNGIVSPPSREAPLRKTISVGAVTMG